MKKKQIEKRFKSIEDRLGELEAYLEAPKEEVKQPKKGTWYKNPKAGGGKLMLCYNGNPDSYQTGFNGRGNWSDNKLTFYLNAFANGTYIEATEEEVKEALLAEAKKRGFVKGCVYRRIGGSDHIVYDAEQAPYFMGNTFHIALGFGEGLIFDCEYLKWGEVVSPPKGEEKTYSIGDWFEYKEEYYVLSRTKAYHIQLICVNDGERYHDPIMFDDANAITLEQMNDLTDGNFEEFTQIDNPYKTKVIAVYFKCIGLEETNVHNWSGCFTIGKNYRFDNLDERANLKDDLKLIDNQGDSMWVDADQFEEVTKEQTK